MKKLLWKIILPRRNVLGLAWMIFFLPCLLLIYVSHFIEIYVNPNLIELQGDNEHELLVATIVGIALYFISLLSKE